MDVRVGESGTFNGRRRLTKKGDPELRRLLCLAVMTARRSRSWKPFYESATVAGLSRIQKLIAPGRKLARIAFALLRNQADHESEVPTMA
jgi:transposase